MAILNPQLTPFKYPHELETLYKQLYLSKSKNDKLKGIEQIKLYLLKGSIPHSLEMTLLLNECILEDENKNGIFLDNYEEEFEENDSNNGDLIIRLGYAMAIIKFVNGLLDPFQQSMYNISLHRLAQELRLPSYFVELRHISTHENLPSLQMLRLICKRALNWMRTEYWEVILNEYKQRGLMDIGDSDWQMHIKESKKKLINESKKFNLKIKKFDELLKTFKKYKKLEIQGNKNVNVNKWIIELNELITTVPIDSFLTYFIFKNNFILHGEKNLTLNEKQLNGLQLMWSCVIESFPISTTMKLWERLFDLVSTETIIEDYNSKAINKNIENEVRINYFSNNCEIKQAKNWIIWIINNIEIKDRDTLLTMINKCLKNSEISKMCLSIIKEKHSNFIIEFKLEGKVKNIENLMEFWVTETSEIRKRKFEDIDTEENSKKRLKIKFFEKAEFYKPVPFGCPP